MKLRLFFVVAIVTAAVTGLARPAAAHTGGQPGPLPHPFTLREYCTFPVLVTLTQFNETTKTTTLPDGTTIQKTTGAAKATVTNKQDTSDVLGLNISGPDTTTTRPDGSFSIDGHGHNLFWTLPALSFPGVPFLNYTTGHVLIEVNSAGLTVGYVLHGTSTDICAALAQ